MLCERKHKKTLSSLIAIQNTLENVCCHFSKLFEFELIKLIITSLFQSNIFKFKISNFSTSNLLVHYFHLLDRLDQTLMSNHIPNKFQSHSNSHWILVDVRYYIKLLLNFHSNVHEKPNHWE